MKFESIEYLGSNFTQAMKEYTEEKISKLCQLNQKYAHARVTLTVLPNKKFSVEVSLDNKVRLSSVGDDFYTVLIEVVDKLFLKLSKYKKYLEKRHSTSPKFDIESLLDFDDETNIVREKTLIVDKMSREEAIAEMEILGHSFFIYRDIDVMDEITVIYKRKDDTYGLILCR